MPRKWELNRTWNEGSRASLPWAVCSGGGWKTWELLFATSNRCGSVTEETDIEREMTIGSLEVRYIPL